MNFEHIAEQISACIPIIGMTSEAVPPAYVKIMVGLTVGAVMTLGGGYVAGKVATAVLENNVAWIMKISDERDAKINQKIDDLSERVTKLEDE